MFLAGTKGLAQRWYGAGYDLSMDQRSDARRNREKLLLAAEEVFAAHGVDAPLELVAERAVVGRGTLYRHFSDRYALAAALYEERLGRYEGLAESRKGEPDGLLVLLAAVAREQARMPGLFQLIFGYEGPHAYLEPLWVRSRELFMGPLEVSRAAGVVRADLSVDDVLIVVGMVYGVVNSPAGMLGAASVGRAMDLVLYGISASQEGGPGPSC